jgi:hypothetical protein
VERGNDKGRQVSEAQNPRQDATVIPLYCQYCGTRIIHDGKHWAKQVNYTVATEDSQEMQSLRNCSQSPIMVRFHVPEGVGEEKRRTHCIPETP